MCQNILCINNTNNINLYYYISMDIDQYVYVEVKKIKYPDILTSIIYNNFLYLENYPDLMHNKNDIFKTLTNNDNFSYFIFLTNKLIGYLIGDFRTLLDNRFVYYISYLYIAKNYRRRNLGTNLMKLIINTCSNIGIKFILLTCDTFDIDVINFYKKFGFTDDVVLSNKNRHQVFCLYL